jgi:thiamine biosynthesis lipoprotein ApbE
MSIDGTPISEADLARIDAEEKLHTEQKRSAVRVVAASALDADDCRTLLSILGLDREIVVAARAQVHASTSTKRPRKRRAAA